MTLSDTIAAVCAASPALEAGHVWLAGAGPGHPRYLTLEVADALSKADCVVYDALVSPEVLAFAGDAELLFAGKRGGKPSATQENITATLIEFAQAGRKVLRLKGGDPFVFGRGGEEAEALAKAGIPFRILPGMTSSLAALASARIPATMRGVSRSITLATGHAAGTDDDLDWRALARLGEPIIVYMGLRMIGEISRLLMEGGLPAETPVAVLMSATTPDERLLVATLATVEAEVERQNFAAPALIVIGDIVSMRDVLTADNQR
ncbi:uroporphyrinogen-III C-methyltransferase [Pseudorhizobium endolithicum]|uniref:uroporphyrinogen-III C-methyltransferase n=1 Tax=Pseudorhizobium endolithicum TaxID=1191678 RepID=A0ABN7JY39_9HYPH|nr:uroporphyrinogen-III C-methyltransferase [Pseudorhizobium endolithicum]CAD7050247.1 uroporphyrinogen-III C-methyltransferase [Pseudorhizobium endolithicum]